MTRHLIIAGHGKLRNGGFDTGATGYIAKGEHRYMTEDLFPAMKKYTDESDDTFIFHTAYKVLSYGNLASLAKKHKADTVTEIHFDNFTKKSTGGHVIVHKSFKPDKLDLRLRDVIKDMIGLRFSHLGHKGIDGRTNLGMVNMAKKYGINLRLLELGFGSNPDEAKILLDQVDEYARKLVQAFDQGTHKSKPKKQPSKRNSVEKQADKVLASGITGNKARANYLGLSLKEYEPIRQEINARYKTGGSIGSVSDLADKVLKTNITGNKARADYLGLTLEQYEPVRKEINSRYQ